ncbi:hypothetical protein TcasGA2_TC033076 [Tribolium castaneum]|uniref:H15 domain-containing protein n=1 Tax=Tribolium castaneum TaxID=7070 RepID=A0A139WIG4_TRICA|nr:hypothetical protein TcasGA2_TC033076 [Tribolium castaneum]
MAPLSKDNKAAARLVLTAIRNLNIDGGASLKHISSYIREKYPQCQSNESTLRKVIAKAVAFGALKRVRNKYALGDILDHIVEARRRRAKSKSKRRRRRQKH